MHMMRQFLRDSYSWDYNGEQETVLQDDEEDYNFLNSIIFESRLMKKNCQKNSKIVKKIDLVKTSN